MGPLLEPDGWTDPRSQGNAFLALAAALSPKNHFARTMLQYGQGLSASDERKQDREQRRRAADLVEKRGLLELANAQRTQEEEAAVQAAAQRAFISPENANARSMGPMPDGSNMPTVQPGFDQRAFLNELSRVKPLKAMEWESKLAKDDKPMVVGSNLVTPSGRVVYQAPDKPEAAPSAVREYEFAKKNDGYKGSFEQWTKDQKKAGANSVSLSVNTEKSLLNELAGGVGKGITGSRDGAQSALGTIGTVNRMMDALDTGKVMAGPGTTFRQFGLQVGNLLGVAGKDANEKLLNTRQTIQSLAQLELDAAQQMKGQGQITEAERSIIRRAASGDIDGMTTGELRLLGGVLDRTARTKIRSHNQQVQPLLQNPNAAPLAPFMTVPEPGERASPSSNVLRFDAQGNPVR